jgi:division protein CdvB (Snf7/Vps24/ESCRT-III family)
MPEDLTKKWQPEEKPSVPDKIREQVVPPEPLRQRLDLAKRKLSQEIQSLDRISDRLETKDKNLYQQLVKAYEDHDTARATSLANELAELRKVEGKTQFGKYALEKAYTKIEVAKDFGDIAAAMAPINLILKNVKGTLADFLPASSTALGELSNIMSETMVSFSNIFGDTSLLAPNQEEADKILKEAATVAESRLKDKLPRLDNLEQGMKQ